MFFNTIGGKYQDLSETNVIYTFPENAYVEISGVRIPIGGLSVQAFGGLFDLVTMNYFTTLAACVTPKSNHVINSSVFINDSAITVRDISLPPRKELEKNGIPYITNKKFVALQTRVANNPQHPEYRRYREVYDFNLHRIRENVSRLSQELQNLLKKNESYPKEISLFYNDSIGSHCTHIVLKFESFKKCKLLIDSTASPLLNLAANLIKDIPLDPQTCVEAITEEGSRYITLLDLKKWKTFTPNDIVEVELKKPVEEILLEAIYKRMIDVLNDMGVHFVGVEFPSHIRNQKATKECVPFTIENKMTYGEKQSIFEEPPREMGIRLRAQHAILSYLLMGVENIPHFDQQEVKDYHISYDYEKDWYTNFPDVCQQLKDRIKNLPFDDLRKLYLAIDLEGIDRLSHVFKTVIRDVMLTKCDRKEYVSIPLELLDQQLEQFKNPIYSPEVLIEPGKTMLVSKTWVKQVDGFRKDKQSTQSAENDAFEQLAGIMKSMTLN